MSKLNLDDRFPFGKYKDVAVSDVVKRDPGYVCWLAIERAKTGVESFSNGVFNALPSKESNQILSAIGKLSKRNPEAASEKLRDTLQANAARLAEQAEITRETTARQEKTYEDFGSW